MIALLFLAAAAAGPSFEPLNPKQIWLDQNDYPVSEANAGRGGVADVKLTVAPSGQPEQCLIVASSGNAVVNATICRLSMKRLRFKPPLSADGAAIYAIWARHTQMLPMGTSNRYTPANTPFTLEVVDTSGQLTKSTAVQVVVEVDSTGALKQCGPRDPADAATMIDRACSEVKTAWIAAPETNAAGATIAYVRWAAVRFDPVR